MRKEKAVCSARLPFAVSMLVFGTIGLLRRFIDLPSGVIACFRGLLGCVLLLLLQRLRGKKPDTASIRRYLLPLLISGGMIGFNWMLLFEAYRYTSIAVATLCYYTAPVMLILASPLVFREQFTWRQLVCVALAACGMVLVSGVLDGGTLPDGTLTGIALAIGSAVLYASITAVNRKTLSRMDAYDKTIVQLGAAGLVMVPYLALTGGFSDLPSDGALRRTDASGVADAYGDSVCDVFRRDGSPADADGRAHELSRSHYSPDSLRARPA